MVDILDSDSVKKVSESYDGDIRTIESFSRCLSVHQLAKFATIGTKIAMGQELLRTDTNNNFDKMDTKYRLISDGMFAIVNELKETNKILGGLEKTEKNIEKTEKNIESLLNILIQQKK